MSLISDIVSRTNRSHD
ncbi:hypothetical protein Ahy_B08g093348 isoform B [Arachis hypogaea]|uniref:Uncharacterized protein n=1 Tax=Arachis hypogaea TaxID=3818 RepID=A0A444Y5S2_ARAHY|nr:hypothetical protein Ahy_B08g093348 isoform B [Arachis hypogaea]